MAELKRVLEKASCPADLDSHPWTKSLTVQHRVAAEPKLQRFSPGYQLLATLAGLFRETMPSQPPRRGKRPDTDWGQFGLLTALYFAPFEFSVVCPTSLVDAWGRIDQVIPMFILGQRAEGLPLAEATRYTFLAEEAEPAPTSTLSDWHIKGLERLASLWLSRETHLSQHSDQPSSLTMSADWPATLKAETNPAATPTASLVWLPRLQAVEAVYQSQARRVGVTAIIVIALLLGWKVWRLYFLASEVRADLTSLQSLADGFDLSEAVKVGPVLARLRQDIGTLRSEAQPLVWVGSLLRWVPVYGPDLAAGDSLLQLAEQLIAAVDESYQGLLPILQATQAEAGAPSRTELLDLLVAARPHLLVAGETLKAAANTRMGIEAGVLSPGMRGLLIEKIDPNLALLQQAVAGVLVAPKLLGATGYGPQTYLILLQNEDELRATGGFITAVASVTIENGEPLAFTVEESYAVDDLSKPYLPAPWQLDRYMASHLWLLRDSNWSPDFPSAAALAEHDYAYTRFHGVEGVLALDQEALRLIVGAVGPLQLEGEPEPITGQNFIQHLRAVKDPSQCSGLDPEKRKTCKVFLRPLTAALLARLQGGEVAWSALGQALARALAERHVLIQMDDPMAAALLAAREWDGAVRPGEGDYLLVVDSNLGFNKVNAAVTEQIAYAVDLSEVATPTARLTLTHTNPTAGGPVGCEPGPSYGTGEYADLIARCYWDYVRVYTGVGTHLRNWTAQAIPAEWMIRGEAVPAQVDILENFNGVRAFGTLLVVPLGQSQTTRFDFALAPQVIALANEQLTYELRIQKQAGTRATPISLEIQLPPGAILLSQTPTGHLTQNRWRIDLTLQTDVVVQLAFRLP